MRAIDFTGGPAQSPLLVEQRSDPRLLLAQQLLAENTAGKPVQSWGEGLAKMLTAGLAGWQGGQVRREYQERGDRYNQDLARMLQAAEAKPWVDPDTGQTSSAPAGGVPGMIAAALNSGNPDLAPMAAQMQMQDVMAREELARALALKQADRQASMVEPLSPQEVQALGLPPGVYQRKADGSISTVARQPDWMNPAYVQTQKDIRSAGKTEVSVNAGPTGVDYGKPEEGLVWARDPDGKVKLDERGAPIAIPYQGGKAYLKQEAQKKTDASQAEQAATAGDVVLTDIRRAREKIESAPWYSPTAGLLGNILKDVGGTAAADVRALTDTVRANIGFDRLQAMREASPTGGALGQVTERELAFLQATLGSLEQSQSEEQLLQNLDRLERVYGAVMKKAAAYPNAGQFGFDAPAGPQPGMVEEGYRFKGGDPADPNSWEKVQ